MRARLTACTDKAFLGALMPLAHLEFATARAVNDNKVSPLARRPTYPSHLMHIGGQACANLSIKASTDELERAAVVWNRRR